ncbi:hypothetical protein [Pseudoroseomonas sp. WGS1072]|uniref:hypothetical protein n=1 Tax=Roseomonas sp. WGS1072 TaxID=3366816 RepID=UPI003BF3273A
MSDQLTPPRPPQGEATNTASGSAGEARRSQLTPEAPSPQPPPESPPIDPPSPEPPPPETPPREDPQPQPTPPSARKHFPETEYGTGECEPPPPSNKA